ncbi:pirin-like C-terminal cupin domain-containing protein [Polycladomyces subterraneus]|uniref:Pirin N-terminal domain-containing protein n=1 Tax=Polycladomyces subterraneus TaxID=1016997 RepID=A0ABT8IKH2_9BACL|nr:pirin-like C-terminal cupin domain-containing protein [Polycladomyces subterraneus]MDN4593272.1 hypothetical protein [Polycladomyces subterraneus]
MGTKSIVGSGGAQVMQTGSGLYHEERFIGPDMEGFQIWFEPFLHEAIKRQPTYHQYEAEEFPVMVQNGFQIKTLIGEGSPIHLTTDVKMWDVNVKPGSEYKLTIPSGYSLATLVIRGNGVWKDEEKESVSTAFQHKDFIVLEAGSQADVRLKADQDDDLHIKSPESPRFQSWDERLRCSHPLLGMVRATNFLYNRTYERCSFHW